MPRRVFRDAPVARRHLGQALRSVQLGTLARAGWPGQARSVLLPASGWTGPGIDQDRGAVKPIRQFGGERRLHAASSTSGVFVTLIQSRRHKVNGTPSRPLPEGVRDHIQRTELRHFAVDLSAIWRCRSQ